MEIKVKPLDCYLRGVSTANVEAGKLIGGIKGAGEREAAKRADAFPESAKPLAERIDARK